MQQVKLRHYINGEFREPSNGEYSQKTTPIDGSVIALVPSGTREDAKAAIDAAYEAGKQWSKLTPIKRSDYIYIKYMKWRGPWRRT